MRCHKILTILIISFSFFACSKKTIPPHTIHIIPAPLSQTITKGHFKLSANTKIKNEDDFKVSTTFLKDYINPVEAKGATNAIEFIKNETISNTEGYQLLITENAITIQASTDSGAFYAVQTLRQLLPKELESNTPYQQKISLPCLTIKDEPRFPYRGMHLDVARHFYPVEFIKKYIDAIALLKMNTFHWHLTDDQGWRIEIKSYPLLNEISAFRNQTLIGHYSDQPHQFDGKKYGGFYTQEQIKDVVSYATSRNITVIPEIEMPGHAQAAIAAYPELGCTGNTVEVATKWGVFEDIFCTNDKTFAFLENVLDEVIPLFPSQYIHIGGDEAPKTNWKKCSQCQRRIQEEGLKDEHELQNYFITRMEKYLNSKGKQIIGWDEILEGGLAPNATVMSWRGTKGAVEAAKQQHNVIMTPTSHCYFDYYQSDNSQEPLAIGGYLPLEKVYHFNPYPEELTSEETKYILGVQGNIWTEYMPTSKQVEYMMFPRALAMSEVAWSTTENKNYSNFVTHVEHFNKRLDVLDFNYANHLYEVEGELLSENNTLSYQLQTVTKDKRILYTVNGTSPTLYSEVYKKPIPISETSTIKAAVFNDNEQLGSVFKKQINFHKAVGKKITINKAPHKAYSGSGAQGLINGINGDNTRFGDKEWLGFWGEDIEITIDLGEDMEINSVKTRFYNGNGQWIYAPSFVEISFDESNFEGYEIGNSEKLLVNFNQNFKTTKARYIKIKVKNYGTIPEGKQGTGNKAWTFMDEIIVN
ncbi:glycoside hydrolase family 20 protein [Lacinutrix salivirga]